LKKNVDVKTLFSVLFIFFVSFVKTQVAHPKYLVFEGAGIRGIAYSGVIEVLEKQGNLEGVEKVAGTSAGALTAMMLSMGYSSGEISDIVSSTRFQKFNDGSYFFAGGIARTIKNFGWYHSDKLSEWVGDLIAVKTGNPDLTFLEWEKAGYKDLYVTGTSLNKQKLVVFSKESYPNMRVRDAVRISMTIPLYFEAAFIDSSGRPVNPDTTAHFDVMVDGGLLGNFPIGIFDEVKVDSLGHEYRVPNPETLGFRIDSDEQIALDSTQRELAEIPIRNFPDYMTALYVMVIENMNRNQLTEADWARTVSISSMDIGPRIKRMPESQRIKLIDSGRKATKSYLISLEGRKIIMK
jgi:NTE family protein